MNTSSHAFDAIVNCLEVFLPHTGRIREPRITVLELVCEYGRAVRREIELEDEVRRLGT